MYPVTHKSNIIDGYSPAITRCSKVRIFSSNGIAYINKIFLHVFFSGLKRRREYLNEKKGRK
jgi:hypothetical protein